MLKYTVSLLIVLFTVNCGADLTNQWVMDPVQEKVCGEVCDYCAQQVVLCNPPPAVYSRDLCMEVVVQVWDKSAAECYGTLKAKQKEVSEGSFCGYLQETDSCWAKEIANPWWN